MIPPLAGLRRRRSGPQYKLKLHKNGPRLAAPWSESATRPVIRQVVGMIPPPAPGCHRQPMMTIIMKDCDRLEGRGVIITAARREKPRNRRKAQVVG